MNNKDDPKNIAGLSSIIQDDDLESNIDLHDLEMEIANGAKNIMDEEIDIAEDCKREMEKLTKNFIVPNDETGGGVDFNKIKLDSPPRSPKYTHQPNNMFEDTRSVRLDTIGEDDDNMGTVRPPSPPYPQHPPFHRNDDHYSSMMGEGGYGTNSYPSYKDTKLKNMTYEEKTQRRINDVLKDIDNSDEIDFNIEKERDEDNKASLLEQIDMLKLTLSDDGIDVSGVPLVEKNSSMNDIQNVYKILRLKSDRNRYCSFAEEIILSGAYGLEYLFDGEKKWFNRSPDLTGWSSTVKVKLRRMRFETSSFVQEVMQEYNMSAGLRLALELIPSMFLYSKSRRAAKNDNLASDSDFKNAMSEMHSM